MEKKGTEKRKEGGGEFSKEEHRKEELERVGRTKNMTQRKGGVEEIRGGKKNKILEMCTQKVSECTRHAVLSDTTITTEKRKKTKLELQGSQSLGRKKN